MVKVPVSDCQAEAGVLAEGSRCWRHSEPKARSLRGCFVIAVLRSGLQIGVIPKAGFMAEGSRSWRTQNQGQILRRQNCSSGWQKNATQNQGQVPPSLRSFGTTNINGSFGTTTKALSSWANAKDLAV